MMQPVISPERPSTAAHIHTFFIVCRLSSSGEQQNGWLRMLLTDEKPECRERFINTTAR